MNDHEHRGARPSGPFTQPVDRRILELDDALRVVEVLSGGVPSAGNMRDSVRAAQLGRQSLGAAGHFSRGTVIHAMPYVNWYKVQAGDGAGWVSACMLSPGGLVPLGPRCVGMARPCDNVLLFTPRGLNFSFIVGVIPPVVRDNSVVCPDWLVQGGGSGLHREAAHMFPIKGLTRGGGVIDWSANRPIDGTSLEQGWITSTGMALTLDDFMFQARVSEQCGLWMTLFDEWCRLAGRHLLLESSVHEETAGDDEGESRYFRGVATFPYEALGLYAPGAAFTSTNDPADVQYREHKAANDLADGLEDIQPVYRYQEYGGYLGQGHMRAVIKPAAESGVRTASSPGFDEGLFRESLALDGSYSLLSAKSIHIGKRVKIIVPRQIRSPEHGGGDDATANNYKFSSRFGDGPEHKIRDLQIGGTAPRSMLLAAAIEDIVAFEANWKTLHPFHYHTGDYRTAQEREQSAHFDRVQEQLDFSVLESAPYLADPSPRMITIDHRYGQVAFYEREAFFRIHDDGSVHIACGYGAEIVLAGGRIRLSAPAGIDLCPGGDLVVLAHQIIARAKGSVDISSSDHDVRLKAEKNLQMLGDGVLIEARGEGSAQQYHNRYGEDVSANGVVLRASQSVVAMLGKDIYARTGGEDLGEGDILLDASRGKRRCQVYGREFNVFTSKSVTFNYGPIDSSSTVRRAYYFGETSAVFDVGLLLRDKLIGYGPSAGVIINGGCYGTKSFATAGVMADKRGMFLGKVPAGFAGTLQAALEPAQTAAEQIRKFGEQVHRTSIVDKYYQDGQIGDDALIADIRFSFRDPPGGDQYRVAGLVWPESRWQAMARLGMASGGAAWVENPVSYQGALTYPWPGRAAWQEKETFARLSEFKLFDAAAGVSVDRPGPYEDATIGNWEKVPMETGFTLTRS